MKSPNIFIPRSKLALPFGMGSEIDVELIREARPLVADLGAAGIIKYHFPFYPFWEESKDGTSGIVQIHQTETGQAIPIADVHIDKGNMQLNSPFNLDGVRIHEDEQKIVTFGVRDTEQVHVFWGVMNIDDLDAVDPAQVATNNTSSDDVNLLAFYHARY